MSQSSEKHAAATHTSDDDIVSRVIQWAARAKYPALPQTAVPGTTAAERRTLAALGAIAGDLVRSNDRELTNDPPAAVAAWLNPGTGRDTSPVPSALVTDLRAVFRDTTGVDVFASLYERAISGTNRRALGTFFTPARVVTHMLELCNRELNTVPEHVIDPGAGVGAFSIAARDEWPNSTVHAVDVNVVTLGLLLVRDVLRKQSANENSGSTQHELADFLNWIEDGLATGGERLFLGNPPYTRVHDISLELREAAFDAAGDLVSSRLAGLSTYFTATILKNLRENDAACLLIPGNWSYANYGRELRAWLWEQVDRSVRLEYFPVETEVFPGTRVTAMILFVGPKKTGRARPTLTVDHLRYDKDAAIAAKASHAHNREGTIPNRLDRVTKPPSSTSKSAATRIPLSNIVKTRRGIATGANSYFFLTDHDAIRLGRQNFVAALTRATHVDGDNLSKAGHKKLAREGHPAWLLRPTEESARVEPLATYLAEGEAHKFHERRLAHGRDPWWAVECVDPPDLFVTPFSRDRYRVIVNAAKAVPSNNLYGIYLKPGAAWTAQQLADYLTSEEGRETLRQVARQYQGGSYKLEPREMLQALVPPRPPG